MNIQELATIAEHNLPVKIVILNNSFLEWLDMEELFIKETMWKHQWLILIFRRLEKRLGLRV